MINFFFFLAFISGIKFTTDETAEYASSTVAKAF